MQCHETFWTIINPTTTTEMLHTDKTVIHINYFVFTMALNVIFVLHNIISYINSRLFWDRSKNCWKNTDFSTKYLSTTDRQIGRCIFLSWVSETTSTYQVPQTRNKYLQIIRAFLPQWEIILINTIIYRGGFIFRKIIFYSKNNLFWFRNYTKPEFQLF